MDNLVDIDVFYSISVASFAFLLSLEPDMVSIRGTLHMNAECIVRKKKGKKCILDMNHPKSLNSIQVLFSRLIKLTESDIGRLELSGRNIYVAKSEN